MSCNTPTVDRACHMRWQWISQTKNATRSWNVCNHTAVQSWDFMGRVWRNVSLLLMVESTENNFELSFVNGPPWSPNRMPVCVSVRFKLYTGKWVSRKLHERHATGSYPTCAALSATGINKTHTAVALLLRWKRHSRRLLSVLLSKIV